MWPWGHLALGYLAYSAITRARGVSFRAAVIVFLVIATQLPDLIDKPLSWSFGLLAAGRSLGHSGLVVGVTIIGLTIVVRIRPTIREESIAISVGLVSHLLGDAIDTLVTGDVTSLSFLAWPVMGSPPADPSRSILGMFLSMEPTPFFLAQLVLTAVALVLWTVDGCPGLEPLQAMTRRDHHRNPP